MRFVLTLIADPVGVALGGASVEAAAEILTGVGATTGTMDWLAPGIACDLPFDGLDPEAAERALRETLPNPPLDLAAQPAEGRRKALLVADLESTIIGQEMLDELAEAVGLRDHVAAITARAMAGELDFAAALRARARLLQGLSADALKEARARMTLDPGARTLVQTLRAGGAYTALVSGGFSVFAEPIGAACGFHEVQANRLLVAAGRLTGGVGDPLLDREAKLACLRRLAEARGLTPASTCALGDGANDVAMLAGAGLGIAYRGTPPARAAARFRLDFGDLTGVLYLQGYRKEEFRD